VAAINKSARPTVNMRREVNTNCRFGIPRECLFLILEVFQQCNCVRPISHNRRFPASLAVGESKVHPQILPKMSFQYNLHPNAIANYVKVLNYIIILYRDYIIIEATQRLDSSRVNCIVIKVLKSNKISILFIISSFSLGF
jgi:hypothetical protein